MLSVLSTPPDGQSFLCRLRQTYFGGCLLCLQEADGLTDVWVGFPAYFLSFESHPSVILLLWGPSTKLLSSKLTCIPVHQLMLRQNGTRTHFVRQNGIKRIGYISFIE